MIRPIFLSALLWGYLSACIIDDGSGDGYFKTHDTPIDRLKPSSTDMFSYPATVRAVIDGDTLEVLYENEKLRIRLKGLDTPELTKCSPCPQRFAQNAKQIVWNAIGNSVVGLEFDSQCAAFPLENCRDMYDRVLSYVRLPGDIDLGEELIVRGLARVYRYNNETFDRLSPYTTAQNIAKSNQQGIWSP